MPESEPRCYPLSAVNGIRGYELPPERIADVKGEYRPAAKRVTYYALLPAVTGVKTGNFVKYHNIMILCGRPGYEILFICDIPRRRLS